MASAAWVVDVGYVVKTAKVSGLFKLDYIMARDLLAELYGPVDGFLFNSYDPSHGIPEGLQLFYNAMRAQGFSVHLHAMSGSAQTGDHRQRRVDVDLACHVIWQATLPRVRHIAITTGDQDILPAVSMAREKFDTSVVLYSYKENVHSDFHATVDESIFFEDHKSRVGR